MTVVPRTALLALLTLLIIPASVAAQERILQFISDVQVERNGDLLVVETIRVQAEGQEIRRGILRDFPTTYRRPDGVRVVVGFDVRSVTRDGSAEQFGLERLGNGVRIRIGNPNVTLQRGPHTYVITYRTTRHVGFFPDYDELYWNATGTGWTFAIDVAEARIKLPENVQFKQTAFYTGPQSAQEKNAQIVEQRPGLIMFRTTQRLPPYNGLTVAAAWEKGIVAPPTSAERAGWLISDNLPLSIGGLGLLALFAYYGLVWLRVGRDPPTGTIIPLFAPPNGMSAAALRYVRHMSFDNRCFTAAIVELGVNGYLKLNGTGKDTVVERRNGTKEIPAPERAAWHELLGARSSIKLEQTNHAILSESIDALRNGLTKAYYGALFHNNTGWAVIGLLAALALMVAIAMTVVSTFDEQQAVLMIVGTVFSIVGIGIVAGTLTSILSGNRLGIGAIIGSLAVVLLIGGGVVLVGVVTSHWADTLIMIPPVIAAGLASLAFFILKAPTAEGRRVMDGIDGFREYLGVAEEDRLQFLHPPEKTPELFEKFLPHAIALDVENAWANRFAGVLAAAAAAGVASTWYSGPGQFSSDAAGFTERLSSDLSYTIAAASTAPGSSSGGSSGGGSSGGGGGGGGGSGW